MNEELVQLTSKQLGEARRHAYQQCQRARSERSNFFGTRRGEQAESRVHHWAARHQAICAELRRRGLQP